MQFSLEEADEILKKEYCAMKVDKRDFDFLNLELNYNFVMSYKFENKKILQRLFTTREKKAF